MKEKDLLQAMGEIHPKYYAEAQQRADAAAAAAEGTSYTEEDAFVTVTNHRPSLMPILTGIGSVAACLLLMVGLGSRMGQQGGVEESSLPEPVQTQSTPTNTDCLHTVLTTTTTLATESTPPETGKQLTMDDVIRLSAKGEALSWEDFAEYQGTMVGSGLYIMRYVIDEDYALSIGGIPTESPLYIYLSYQNDRTIDIRTEDVAAFVKESVHTPPEPKRFTLEEIIALSAKGQALSWKDFFDYEEIESDGEIEICQLVTDDFTLKVGGKPDAAPVYANLIYKDGLSMDIRTGDVEAFITACRTPEQQAQLTLYDIMLLSTAKGEALSWEDFANYAYTDVGSGLYIYEYIIDADFVLHIGGVPSDTPLYMNLSYRNEKYIDIRTEDVSAFIEECLTPAPEKLPVTVMQTNKGGIYYGDGLGYYLDHMMLQQPPDVTTWKGTIFDGLEIPETMQQDAFYEENICILLAINQAHLGYEYGIQSLEITADGVLHFCVSEFTPALLACATTDYFIMVTVPKEHLPEITGIEIDHIEKFEPVDDGISSNAEIVYEEFLASLPEELYLTVPAE